MKCADKNDVVSTFMDFSGEAISGFERANQTALEKIARLLIEAQVQVNLDEV